MSFPQTFDMSETDGNHQNPDLPSPRPRATSALEENEEQKEKEKISQILDLDLPLSANREEVIVHHYIFDLVCDINSNIIEGVSTFFIEGQEFYEQLGSQMSNRSTRSIPCFVLDSFALEVIECWTFDLSEINSTILKSNFSSSRHCPLKVSQTCMDNYINLFSNCQKCAQKRNLPYVVQKHFIKIELPHLKSWSNVQTFVAIRYRTHPDGPSLMWTTDQDNRPCVFTIGDSLNNRSLFPSQDMPKAMATWHCKITLPPNTPLDMTVLVTGEEECFVIQNEKNERIFEYFNTLTMPMSTFALAIGCWSCSTLSFPTFSKDSSESTEILLYPKCRLFSPSSLKGKSSLLFNKYLPKCFDALTAILQPFPLKRLDFLVVPQCFDSLGLASPHLIFISHSLLCDDLSMFHRVSHEICHTWFGILTGPRDWTEEWLTEGICCYLEDIVHAKAMEWAGEEERQRNGLRTYQKYQLLKAELDITPDHLQLLRPEKGKTKSGLDEKVVKNGINSEKSFMQVHYLKGFFLLKHLENIAGQTTMLQALREFTIEHLGLLFSSQELLDFFFTHCKNLKESALTADQICQEWLDCPGVPQALTQSPVNMDENYLYQDVVLEFESLKKSIRGKRHWKRKSNSSKRTNASAETTSTLTQMTPDQTMLLVGKFLEEGQTLRVSSSFMDSFRNSFIKEMANAEILHGWCEMIIEQKASKWFSDVEEFLMGHRAMGLYLYGEMMISENSSLQSLAFKCYQRCRSSMPRAALKELEEILGVAV